MSKLNLILLLVSTLTLSCQDEAATTAVLPAKKYFVSATKNSELQVETLRALASGFGQKRIADLLKYSVSSYTMVYETTYKGKAIQASGLVLVPKGLTSGAPLISLQHGTTFEKDDAPTSAGGYTGMELFASAGYIALVPDFIGYGASSEIFHPYYDETHSAFTVIDMIKAAREFLAKEKINFNDKLFLAGYSEGGYVTMAAASEIDQNKSHGLSLTAVAAGAGGYDLIDMLQGVTTNTFYSYPAYLAFVLMSYNNTYDWNRPLNDFFRQQYADSLSKYMTGEYGGSYINGKLTTDVTKLFNSEFNSSLKTPGAEQSLKEALVKNSIQAWKTDVPMRLYHGSKDEIVPYQNSERVVNSLQQEGSSNVSFKLISGGSHGSSFLPMLEDFIPWFLQLNTTP